tara:strand:- start:501 stop:1274 length:774 start_codon:yes stop_codon:yes gene_type:complete
MGFVNKKQLEEVCVFRQPVTFALEEKDLESYFNSDALSNNFSRTTFNIYDVSSNHIVSTPLTMVDVKKLFNQQKNYVSYNNNLFIEDTITKSKLQTLDKYLSPPLTVYSHYDVWLGTNNKSLPTKTETYYREYIYITSGYIECLLITPNKEKTQSIIVNKSEVLYIPPYWSYKITFKKNAFVCVFRYDTSISILSRLPNILMNYIGDQLVTEISYKLKTKTIDIADDNNVSDSMSKKTRGRISKKRDKKVDPSNNIV